MTVLKGVPCCYRENSHPPLEHWFSKMLFFFRDFRMTYFMNIEVLYEKIFFFIISKYCPISNSNVNTIVTDI